jgi:hypothetical protein
MTLWVPQSDSLAEWLFALQERLWSKELIVQYIIFIADKVP